MSQADLEINRDARKVLVRHWIDLGKLSCRSVSGRLSIRGSLQRISGVPVELTSALVETIFNDLRKIRGVVNITSELDNWSFALGKWNALDKGKIKIGGVAQSAAQAAVVDISDGN